MHFSFSRKFQDAQRKKKDKGPVLRVKFDFPEFELTLTKKLLPGGRNDPLVKVFTFLETLFDSFSFGFLRY